MARRREDGTTKPVKAGGWQPERMSTQETKKTAQGNSKPDQAWLAALDEGDLLEFPIDPATKKYLTPDECYWDVKFQFQGLAEEVDPEFFEDFRRGDKTRKCTGLAYVRDERGGYIIDLEGIRLQRPCLQTPMNGSMVCQKHGGQLGHVKRAAENRLTHAAEKAATTLITLTDTRDEEGELVEQSVRIKAANSVLDRVGIKAGQTIEMDMPGFKNVMDRLFTGSSGEGEE
jgi:hypothetical protein